MEHFNDDKLYEYLDGEMSENDKMEIEYHLSNCGICQTRLEELKRIENELAKIIPSDLIIKEAEEKIKAEVYENCINEKNIPFYKKTLNVTVAGMTGIAAAFVMIMIGAIVIFNPNNNNLTQIIPGANANINENNIYKVSNNRELTIEEHVKAIEAMGYDVILEKK